MVRSEGGSWALCSSAQALRWARKAETKHCGHPDEGRPKAQMPSSWFMRKEIPAYICEQDKCLESFLDKRRKSASHLGCCKFLLNVIWQLTKSQKANDLSVMLRFYKTHKCTVKNRDGIFVFHHKIPNIISTFVFKVLLHNLFSHDCQDKRGVHTKPPFP